MECPDPPHFPGLGQPSVEELLRNARPLSKTCCRPSKSKSNVCLQILEMTFIPCGMAGQGSPSLSHHLRLDMEAAVAVSAGTVTARAHWHPNKLGNKEYQEAGTGTLSQPDTSWPCWKQWQRKGDHSFREPSHENTIGTAMEEQPSREFISSLPSEGLELE